MLAIADIEGVHNRQTLAVADDKALADVRHRLERLSTAVEQQPTEIADALAVHDEGETLYGYLVAIRGGRELQVQAREVTLRAERRLGELLLQHVRLGNGRTTLWRRSRTGPARGGSAKVKPGVLEASGVTAKQSSWYQALARVDGDLFEAELARRRERGVPASRRGLLALQAGLVRNQPRRSTPTAAALRGALERLDRVQAISTQDELALVRRILELADRWGAQLRRASSRPGRDGQPTDFTCLVCSRTLVARRCPCGGWFTETPASVD